jgi:hypothetical protein
VSSSCASALSRDEFAVSCQEAPQAPWPSDMQHVSASSVSACILSDHDTKRAPHLISDDAVASVKRARIAESLPLSASSSSCGPLFVQPVSSVLNSSSTSACLPANQEPQTDIAVFSNAAIFSPNAVQRDFTNPMFQSSAKGLPEREGPELTEVAVFGYTATPSHIEYARRQSSSGTHPFDIYDG